MLAVLLLPIAVLACAQSRLVAHVLWLLSIAAVARRTVAVVEYIVGRFG